MVTTVSIRHSPYRVPTHAAVPGEGSGLELLYWCDYLIQTPFIVSEQLVTFSPFTP